MELAVVQADGAMPVTILALNGDLDASNFEDVIAKAQSLYGAGTRRLVLDLSGVPFMGSSGLVALHSVAMLLRGERPPDPEYGWQAFHDLEHDAESQVDPNLKLVGPQPSVQRTLDITGMNALFGIYPSREAALNSY
jgi:anti-anti-sigma regulatory factor